MVNVPLRALRSIQHAQETGRIRQPKRQPKPQPAPPPEVKWSKGQPSDRQRKLVDILTRGFGCSLHRACKLSGYQRHRPSLDQLLSSAEIVGLFAEALEQGRTLPPKFAERIIEAVAAADVAGFE